MRTSQLIWLGSGIGLAMWSVEMATGGGGISSLDRLHSELRRLHAADANAAPLSHGMLSTLFPAYDWYTVTFRQFPVGRIMPEPLKPSNLFAVPRAAGRPLLINSQNGLRDFFREKMSPVLTADQAREAAQAWLQAATALHQDGFYQFKIEEESIKAEANEGGIQVSGKAIAMRGGNGTITVSFAFDKKGRLLSLMEGTDLHPGPRPICHATKLLDPDPIVRNIVEQDLLIMGPAAKPYLDEVRRAAKPELRRAIDQIWDKISREHGAKVTPPTDP
jgi:hypothetical protein